MLRLAGEYRTDLNTLDRAILDFISNALGDFLACCDNQLASDGMDDVVNRYTSEDTLLEGSNHLVVVLELGADKTTQSSAILLANDDVVSNVDQTTGEVTGIGRLEGGIGQTLTGTVRRDKVLEGRHAFLKVGDNRVLDNLCTFGTSLLRLGHQTTHT